jgi:hypothetical protein
VVILLKKTRAISSYAVAGGWQPALLWLARPERIFSGLIRM